MSRGLLHSDTETKALDYAEGPSEFCSIRLRKLFCNAEGPSDYRTIHLRYFLCYAGGHRDFLIRSRLSSFFCVWLRRRLSRFLNRILLGNEICLRKYLCYAGGHR